MAVKADGGVGRPLPNGDWVWVDENSQQAFINYEQGTEKLIVSADIEEENSDIVWIMPIPSNPEKVEIDITSGLPFFFGDEVISKAKLQISEDIKSTYYAGLLGQLSPFPFLLVSLGGAHAKLALGDETDSGDFVLVEKHLEKAGMVTEVITAKNSQAIYDYFSKKGFNIKQGSISELNSYIEKDYSFVVSWIAAKSVADNYNGQRGIFISFPISKIYYPLILTSVYGEAIMPITIRVLDHVKPEIFSDIKDYTEINYYTERTKGYYSARTARCQSDMRQLETILEMYYGDYYSYPSSIQQLLNSSWGEETKNVIEDINKYCESSLNYFSQGSDDYKVMLGMASGLYEINSSGFNGFIDKENGVISPELQKFYGDKKPWLGESEYTKITINAPAKLLKKDLWMENGRPFKISLALSVINNHLFFGLFLYILIVGIVSFIAGGVAGYIRFRKLKKYALIGLGNILSLIGLALTYFYIKRKKGEDVKYSRISFIPLFSVFFILSLVPLSIILIPLGVENGLWLMAVISFIFSVISWAIFLSIRFISNKIINKFNIKNRLIKALFAIVIFIIFFIVFLITIYFVLLFSFRLL